MGRRSGPPEPDIVELPPVVPRGRVRRWHSVPWTGGNRSAERLTRVDRAALRRAPGQSRTCPPEVDWAAHGRPLLVDRPTPERVIDYVGDLAGRGTSIERIAYLLDLPVELVDWALYERRIDQILAPDLTPPEPDEGRLPKARKDDRELADQQAALAGARAKRRELRQTHAGLFDHVPPGADALNPPPELADHPAIVESERLVQRAARRRGLR